MFEASSVYLVRLSWMQVLALGPQAAALFDEPGFAGLGGTGAQRMAWLDAVLAQLDRPDALRELLQQAGRALAPGMGEVPTALRFQWRHALLAALARALGDDFTPLLRAIWAEVFDDTCQLLRAQPALAEAA